MAGKGLNVFVNIGAKIGSSVDSSIRATEAKFARMGRVVAAEGRAAERMARIGSRVSSFGPKAAGYTSGVRDGSATRLAGYKADAAGLDDMAGAVGAASARSSSAFLRMGEAATAARYRIRLAAAETKADMVSLEERQASRHGAIFGGLLGLYAAKKLMEPAQEYQLALARMGNTAKVFGPDLDRAGRRILAIGEAYGVGGSHAVDGAHAYIAAGLGMKNSLAALPATFKFSATTGLHADDTARAGVAVMHNLGVQANQVERAFDVMVEAQKHGKIQAQDMARFFPTLTASAQKLGITGVQGVAQLSAAMEQVRFGTNDAGSAATNLNQLLQKMASPTMTRSFAKMGISLPAIWKEAKAKGGNYFDMVLDRVAKITHGGADPFIMGKLFGRDQARNAAQSLIQYHAELVRTRAEVANSAGILERDWERVSGTAAIGTRKMGAAVQALEIRLGLQLLPTLAGVTSGTAQLVGKMGAFVDRHPRMVAAAVGIVGGFAGLRIASVGLAWATGFLNLQLLATKGQILSLGGGIIGAAVRGFNLLRNSIASAQLLMAVGGVRALGAAILEGLVPQLSMGAIAAGVLDVALAPITLAALALGAAVGLGYLAFLKLKNVGAFFGPFGRAFMKAIGPMAPAIRPVVGAMKEVGGWVAKLFSPIAAATWASWGDAVGTALGKAVGFLLKMIEAMGKIGGFMGHAAVGDWAGAGMALFGGGAGGGAKVDAAPPRKAGVPLGLSQGNPMNLRRWNGRTTADGFAAFDKNGDGMRAGAEQLRLYYNRDHLRTVDAMIAKFAPKGDRNDTAAYQAFVRKEAGFNAFDANDPKALAKVIGAMARRETGFRPSMSDLERVATPSPGPVMQAKADAAVAAQAGRLGGGVVHNHNHHAGHTITINGAHDPHETRRQVELALADHARRQDARLTD